jgi:membrane protease YdiL (CAAX protease family)
MKLLLPSPLEQLHPPLQLLFLLGIILFSASIGVALLQLILSVTSIDIATIDWKHISKYEVNVMRWVQGISAIFTFVLPALLYAYLQRHNWSYLSFRSQNVLVLLFLTTIITLCLMASGNWLMELNQQLDLPATFDSLEKAMRAAEDQAAEATSAFLQMDSFGEFIGNLIVVAMLAALGEELLFRGALQPTLQRWFNNNHHAAIWVAAALFSFIHFQFYGFLPRMVLGAVFGYLYYWSGNLLYPIVAHLLNNGLAVIAVYALGVSPDAANEADSGVPWYASALATVVMVFLLRMFQQYNRAATSLAQNSADETFSSF